MKFRYILLLDVVLVAGLIGAVFLSQHFRHRRDKLAWNTLYRDARESYSHAAALKDAEASQFDPRYSEAATTARTLETFTGSKGFGVGPESSASLNLTSCVSGLQAYRLPIPTDLNVPAVKLRLTRMVDHCVADGRTGQLGDTK
jgi:hypothetical protein